MGYKKLIRYGEFVETYEYEKPVLYHGRKGKRVQESLGMPSVPLCGEDLERQREQKNARRKTNIRNSVLAFKRLVLANLGPTSKPLFVSLTYAGITSDLREAREDFKSFSKNLHYRFGDQVRYICVPEWQKRGSIHFHALVWGLPLGLVKTERNTRLVASLWGKGFVDLKETDGHAKIASYLSKYMSKVFIDERLSGKKCYTTSRNIKRPIVEKNPIMLMYNYGELLDLPDLSTATLLQEKEYMTQWLGQAIYKKYQLI